MLFIKRTIIALSALIISGLLGHTYQEALSAINNIPSRVSVSIGESIVFDVNTSKYGDYELDNVVSYDHCFNARLRNSIVLEITNYNV